MHKQTRLLLEAWNVIENTRGHVNSKQNITDLSKPRFACNALYHIKGIFVILFSRGKCFGQEFKFFPSPETKLC